MIQVMPLLLVSKASIASRFSVAQRRIIEWHKQGAPISFDGSRYSAEMNALQSWLVERSKA